MKTDQNGLNTIQLAAGEILFEQGEEIFNLFMIESGKVELYYSDHNLELDKQKPFITLGPGDVMGEVAVFGSKTFMSTAKTVEPTEVRIVNLKEIQQAFASSPKGLQKIVMSTLSKAKLMIDENRKMLSVSEAVMESQGFLLGSALAAIELLEVNDKGMLFKSEFQKTMFRLFGIRADVFEKTFQVLINSGYIMAKDDFSFSIENKEELKAAIRIFVRATNDTTKNHFFEAPKATVDLVQNLQQFCKSNKVGNHDKQCFSLQKWMQYCSDQGIKFDDMSFVQLSKLDLGLDKKPASQPDQGVQLCLHVSEIQALKGFLSLNNELRSQFS